MPSRRGVAAAAAVMIALASATAFVVGTRHELHSTQSARRATELRLARLDAELRTAAAQRGDATQALQQANDLLRSDTAARDRLQETNRLEYARFVAALDDLARHRAAVATDTARAQRLDACLLGASQVLNEAAVGDTTHLAASLPAARQLCDAAET